MYRCTPTGNNIIYCAPCDLRNERDIEAVEDLVDIKEMYPKVQKKKVTK